MRFNLPKDNSGFTLMEVLLAMVLLGIIMIYLTQYQSSVLLTRETVLHDGDFYTEIRLATTILEKDIRMIYSPIGAMPSTVPPKLTLEEQQKLGDLFRGEERVTSEFWMPIFNLTGARPSRFQGEEGKISFVTSSNARVYYDSSESIFAKIEYELKPGLTDIDREKDTRSLTRIINTKAFSIDDTDDEQRRVYPLLSGVKSLKFEFYNQTEDRWDRSWDSESSEILNRIPDTVKVSLTVVSPKDKEFEGVFIIKPEVPTDELPKTY